MFQPVEAIELFLHFRQCLHQCRLPMLLILLQAVVPTLLGFLSKLEGVTVVKTLKVVEKNEKRNEEEEYSDLKLLLNENVRCQQLECVPWFELVFELASCFDADDV